MIKERAYSEAFESYNLWFRRKYNLPPNDPRFLELTDIDIEEDYWSNKFFDYLEEKRIVPHIDEFDNYEIDDEIERWEKEDADFLIKQELLEDEDGWETVESKNIEIK